MRLASEVLISEDHLRQRVDVMAQAIALDTPEGRSLSVIALLDGAFLFCADLVRRLPMPVHVALSPVISIHRGGDPTAMKFPEGFPLRGADILVVEDILDTGETLGAVHEHLMGFEPRSLRLAVLLDKPARRKVGIEPDYVGFRVQDHWVVGYGLDWEGLYRNLPYISYVES